MGAGPPFRRPGVIPIATFSPTAASANPFGRRRAFFSAHRAPSPPNTHRNRRRRNRRLHDADTSPNAIGSFTSIGRPAPPPVLPMHLSTHSIEQRGGLPARTPCWGNRWRNWRTRRDRRLACSRSRRRPCRINWTPKAISYIIAEALMRSSGRSARAGSRMRLHFPARPWLVSSRELGFCLMRRRQR